MRLQDHQRQQGATEPLAEHRRLAEPVLHAAWSDARSRPQRGKSGRSAPILTPPETTLSHKVQQVGPEPITPTFVALVRYTRLNHVVQKGLAYCRELEVHGIALNMQFKRGDLTLLEDRLNGWENNRPHHHRQVAHAPRLEPCVADLHAAKSGGPDSGIERTTASSRTAAMPGRPAGSDDDDEHDDED